MAAGVDVTMEEWPDMPHVFQVFDQLTPQGGRAIKSAASFIRSVTPPSAADGAGVGDEPRLARPR